MELKEQVITLEQAKRLHELGFKREYLYRHIKPAWFDAHIERVMELWYVKSWAVEYSYPAYTASELMEILPHYIKNGKVLQVTKWRSCYIVTYGGECDEAYITKDGNLACALWNTLIRLLENNLLPDTTTEWA